MIIRRWGVEAYDTRMEDPQPTVRVPRRFWTLAGATEYAARRIDMDRRGGRRTPVAFRPVRVRDYLAAVRKSWGYH